MNPRTQRRRVDGPAGAIDAAVDEPDSPAQGVALFCHPHPQHGGTMDNKVVQTLARAAVAAGWRAVRFNFRGVGGSEGAWDHGRGEIDDALAVAAAVRDPALPFVTGGFSFGGYVATHVAARGGDVKRLMLVAPAVTNFQPAAVAPDTLLVHGEADDVVPLSAVLAWARPLPLPVVVVPGAGHFFHGQLSLLKHIVLGAWPR
jgi:alpha/beta superfamily hydrolase